jgi:hypothetical protein
MTACCDYIWRRVLASILCFFFLLKSFFSELWRSVDLFRLFLVGFGWTLVVAYLLE